jgi:hypothetical protein
MYSSEWATSDRICWKASAGKLLPVLWIADLLLHAKQQIAGGSRGSQFIDVQMLALPH